MPGFLSISTRKMLKTPCKASYKDGGETEGARLLQPGREMGEGRPTSSPQYLT